MNKTFIVALFLGLTAKAANIDGQSIIENKLD